MDTAAHVIADKIELQELIKRKTTKLKVSVAKRGQVQVEGEACSDRSQEVDHGLGSTKGASGAIICESNLYGGASNVPNQTLVFFHELCISTI